MTESRSNLRMRAVLAPADVANDLIRGREDRDRWIRLFNRLQGAVSHHRNARVKEAARGLTIVDEIDEALYAAMDRVLRDAAKGDA